MSDCIGLEYTDGNAEDLKNRLEYNYFNIAVLSAFWITLLGIVGLGALFVCAATNYKYCCRGITGKETKHFFTLAWKHFN